MNYFAGVAFYMITKHIIIVMVGPRRVMYKFTIALQRVNGGGGQSLSAVLRHIIKICILLIRIWGLFEKKCVTLWS